MAGYISSCQDSDDDDDDDALLQNLENAKRIFLMFTLDHSVYRHSKSDTCKWIYLLIACMQFLFRHLLHLHLQHVKLRNKSCCSDHAGMKTIKCLRILHPSMRLQKQITIFL